MGFYVIMAPTEVKEENETAIGKMCIDVFGKGWKTFKIAHLFSGDKIGFELFEFKESKNKKSEFDPFRTGLFHFCVQDPDVEGLVKKIVWQGVNKECPLENITLMINLINVLCRRSFGVVFEVYSHSYELHYSAGAYK